MGAGDHVSAGHLTWLLDLENVAGRANFVSRWLHRIYRFRYSLPQDDAEHTLIMLVVSVAYSHWR